MPAIQSNGYTIYTGKTVFRSLAAFLSKHQHSTRFILCDENTLQHCLPLLITSCPALSEAEIIEIESGEESKSLEFTAQILQTLLENQADKHALIINLGGGVVSDLGGFAASIYKRGIDFINLPTSLLAMADASVGGKTGIDFSGIKNSVGTFAQPKAVFIHTGFLSSLPPRHYQNGLAEVFKIALVADKKLWAQLKAISERTAIAPLIVQSVSLKNNIVLKDPFDKGRRKTLNFGHTIGHAIESLLLGTPQELLHGEAIVLGMITESHLAFQKQLIGKQTLTEIVTTLLKQFPLSKIALPPAGDLLRLARNDKKTAKGGLNFSLLSGIGACKFDIAVTEAQVKKALAYYQSL